MDKKPCKFYHRNGWCAYGDTCKFSHVSHQSATKFKFKSKKNSNSSQNGYNNKHQKIKFKKTNNIWKYKNETQISEELQKLCEQSESPQKELVELLEKPNFQGILETTIPLKFKICEQIVMLLTHDQVLHSLHQSKTNNLITKAASSRFVKEILPRYLRNGCITEEEIRTAIRFFKECLTRCPEKAASLPINDLEDNVKKLENTEIQKLYNQLKNQRRDIENKDREMLNSTSDPYIQEDDQKLENEMKTCPIFPELNDLEQMHKMVKKNKIHEKWNSVEEYITTHFFLLREDYLNAIREGLKNYNTPDFDPRDLPVYENVRIVRQTLNLMNRVVAYVVTFDRKKNINWEASKLLLPGSLVCLFETQNGKNIIGQQPLCATVCAYEREKIGNGVIEICPCKNGKLQVDPKKKYLMIESPCYFKSIEPGNTIITTDIFLQYYIRYKKWISRIFLLRIF